MFCLFCTIPAEKNCGKKSDKGTKKPSITKSILTWILIFVWVSLITFGLVSAASPSWLNSFAKHGRVGESRQVKDAGDFFLRDKNYKRALAQYERALNIEPDFTAAIVNSAIAYNLSGNPEKGIKLLKEAIKHDPEHISTIYFNIGEILHGRGKYTEALEYYNKAIGAEIEPELLYKKLIVLYKQTEQFEQARIAGEKLLELQNDPIMPYINMLHMYSSMYKIYPEHKNFFETEFQRELTLENLDDYDFEIITKLSNTDPEVAKTHNKLAVLYAMKGDIDKAIEHFEKSAEIWPGNKDAVKNLKILRQAKSSNKFAAVPPK